MKGSQSRKDNRRDFIKQLLGWGAGILFATLAYPLLKFTAFKAPPKPRFITVKGPLPVSGFHSEREFILFDDGKNRPVAVSRTCTHLGCRINYHEDKHYIECPCHQSRFTPEGKRIAGPAEKDLISFDVETQRDAEGRITSYVVQL